MDEYNNWEYAQEQIYENILNKCLSEIKDPDQAEAMAEREFNKIMRNYERRNN